MKKKSASRAAPARAAGKARGRKAQARAAARAKAASKAKAASRKVAAVQPAAAPAPVVAAAAAPASDAFFLKLDANCTLRETADLQFSLVAANGDPVVVDGSAVERVDTAGLQLLVALARRQQHSGRRLEWKAASAELLKCGERLGLLEALALTGGAGATP
jgi:phospholipid transport system transporter-binding protein